MHGKCAENVNKGEFWLLELMEERKEKTFQHKGE
jgi:hypothetical protein